MVASHGRFVWYELMTLDPAAATAFYANTLGWDVERTSMPGATYTLFTADKMPVSGMMELPGVARKMGTSPHWIGYIEVDNVDTTTERIKQLGGAVHIPPTDVPAISRFSIVADPQMATLALIKGRESGRERAVEPAKPGHVGWHELLAADWETALAFYGELFGWQKAESHVGSMGVYQQFSVAGETIGGMFTKPATLPVPFWLYYFNVGDINAAAKRVETGGGEILYGPTTVPGGADIVHCVDPQGAIFALLDRRSRGPVGYFESAASGSSSDARTRRWSW